MTEPLLDPRFISFLSIAVGAGFIWGGFSIGAVLFRVFRYSKNYAKAHRAESILVPMTLICFFAGSQLIMAGIGAELTQLRLLAWYIIDVSIIVVFRAIAKYLHDQLISGEYGR